ncbi:hypothetical protein PANA5342_1794 [Pantoea ananatis LMG 5342]|nr:hypothetical protein PANA5342_1794 [Pantoea ananatis LMG 5342]
MRSEQNKFFADRVREEDFYGLLPIATLHQQNKKKRFGNLLVPQRVIHR